MANTYTQIFIHAVFAVKYRNATIPLDNSEEIYAYMGGIINRHLKCQSIKIGGFIDHVHLLLRIAPNVDVSELIQSIKIGSTNFINEKHLTHSKFAWQEGFGAFSVSATHTDSVVNYIDTQVQHHGHILFIDEYQTLLDKNKIEYDKRYIFKGLE